MKTLKIDLKLVVKGIKAINSQLDKVIKAVEDSTKKSKTTKKQAPKKKASTKKAAAKKDDQATAFDTVVKIIAKSKQGVNTSKIKDKTGFDNKKIANIIYKAKNRKLIKTVSKGLYTKA